MSERARAKELLNQLGMSERRKQIYRDGIERATEADLAAASEGLEEALSQVDAALETADQILARQRERAAAGRNLASVPQDDARNAPVTIDDNRAMEGIQQPELAQPAENGSEAGDRGPAATNPTPARAPRSGSPRALGRERSNAEWPRIIAALLGDDRRKHQEARALLWSAVSDYVVRHAQLPIGPMADDEDARHDIAVAVLHKLERNDYAHLRRWMHRYKSGRDIASWWPFIKVVTRATAIDRARASRLNLSRRPSIRTPWDWAVVEPVDPSVFAETLAPQVSSPDPFLEPLWEAKELSSDLTSLMGLSPRLYDAALRFAAGLYHAQHSPGSDYLLVRAASVATETMTALEPGHDADLAVGCAWLHDAIEHTGATHTELADRFGVAIADGVRALSKEPTLPEDEQLADSLRRIQLQPPEVAMVKLAEGITNLESPPSTWSRQHRLRDRDEAIMIADALGPANVKLAGRLRDSIAAYAHFL